MSTHIRELSLSTRAYYALLNSNVETIEQLLAMNLKELLRTPNCGKVTLQEIETVVAEYNQKRPNHEISELLKMADLIEEIAAKFRQKVQKLQAIYEHPDN